jgi:hypothetical protein
MTLTARQRAALGNATSLYLCFVSEYGIYWGGRIFNRQLTWGPGADYEWGCIIARMRREIA